MDVLPEIRRGERLAEHTSLGLGGPASGFVEVRQRAQLVGALRHARQRGLPTLLLGGGSNLVVGDEGFDGWVIALRTRGVELRRHGDLATLKVQAGERWDDVVALAVREGLAGIECLSGIPGTAGATPIQNVGAYGQEVSQTLRSVEVLDRATLEARELDAEDCAFGYRDSRFKREPDQFVVLSATFELVVDGVPKLRYGELRRALEGQPPSLERTRAEVLKLRRTKSMVLDSADPNSRSAGSFFTNPVVDGETLRQVQRRALDRGLVRSVDDVPCYPAPGGHKLAAGWLIERSGMAKGTRRGAVGISERHALALVHYGGGTTRELLALASEVRASVRSCFGVELTPEPVMVGVDPASWR